MERREADRPWHCCPADVPALSQRHRAALRDDDEVVSRLLHSFVPVPNQTLPSLSDVRASHTTRPVASTARARHGLDDERLLGATGQRGGLRGRGRGLLRGDGAALPLEHRYASRVLMRTTAPKGGRSSCTRYDLRALRALVS